MVKPYSKIDPHREREAGKYACPVPSREHITQFLEAEGKPVSLTHMLAAFEITTEEEQEGLRRRLQAMTRDGQLISNRRGSYALVDELNLISGTILANRDGSGFVHPSDGSGDIFLSPYEMSSVFNLDRVLVRVTSSDFYRGRREGSIAEVIEHNTHQVVGRYFEEDGIAFVDPSNKLISQDIIIASDHRGSAKHGQYVVAKILVQPRKRRQPLGQIIEILGDQLTPGLEVELAIRAHNLPHEWPQAVLDEAEPIAESLMPKDLENRLDLRKCPFVTIDGEDAKDFDDAIFCERINQQNKAVGQPQTRLYVAIADVAHYVEINAALDKEASNRGNSIYFPNKVIPMLPEKLSNGLCSLNPNTDRLVVVCIMEFDQLGRFLKFKFKPAVIHSHARLTYTEAMQIFEKPTEHHQQQSYFLSLRLILKLYRKLQQKRSQRGALDFETVETRIVFTDNGKIDCIKPTERNTAHRVIEEAMLQANTCAAEFLRSSKLPFLYRVHEGPDAQKLATLRDFLKAFKLRLTGGDKPSSLDYARLLQRISKRDDAALLQMMLLRSLRQATYTTDNLGHFGLAYPVYTHFTSPIRRYPDLLVHRAIKHVFARKKQKNLEFAYDQVKMKTIGEHCSITERRADLATREATDWLKCEYIQGSMGKQFKGTISEVTSFGLFVQLTDIYIHGLVHITALPNDYYHFDPIHHLLRGRRSGKMYRLGDHVKIIVARVNLEQRQIDFELVANKKECAPQKRVPSRTKSASVSFRKRK